MNLIWLMPAKEERSPQGLHPPAVHFKKWPPFAGSRTQELKGGLRSIDSPTPETAAMNAPDKTPFANTLALGQGAFPASRNTHTAVALAENPMPTRPIALPNGERVMVGGQFVACSDPGAVGQAFCLPAFSWTTRG